MQGRPQKREDGMSQDSSGPECPVCKGHNRHEALDSQGVILTGMQAMLDKDFQTVKDVFSTLTPWDAHCAITMLLYFVSDICALTGQDIRESVADMRQQVLNAQAQQ